MTMTYPIVGQSFGRYLVDAFVAEGGMGAVFRARDAALGRTVALKVIRSVAADQTARFLREAKLAARLGHPNIVTIHDVGEVAGTPYLVMEWLDGAPLSGASADLPVADRLRILGELADALAYAHAQGVIHRDVKPANVVLERSGRAKLVDFGLARRSGDPAGEGSSAAHTFHTGTGQILGTPAYMAPEQWATSEVTVAADQFSWGVVAFQWLNGVHPKELVPSFPFADRGSVLRWSARSVPPAVIAVVERTMELDPRARFANMRSVVLALRAAIGPLPGEATPRKAPGAPSPNETPGALLSGGARAGEASGVATEAPVAHRAPAAPTESGAPLAVGSLFERYEIAALLGRGGMGDVYRAFDTRLRRAVALKVLRGRGDERGRVLAEARAMAGLTHRNVVTVYDVGEHAGTGYLTMELVEGTPLDRWAGPTHGRFADKARWLREIASALGAVHSAGLLHRDVKPSNVLVTADGTSKLLDFGIAKSTEGNPAEGANPTATGFVRGTPGYLAPEQLMGEPATVASDEYAWALVAVELLTGRLPHPGTVTAPALASAGVPSGLGRVLERALALRPSARYPSIGELVRDLDRASSETASGVGPGPSWGSAPTTPNGDGARPPLPAFAPTALAPAVAPFGGPAPPLPPTAGPWSALGDALFFLVLFGIGGVAIVFFFLPRGGGYRPRTGEFNVVFYRGDGGSTASASASASASAPPNATASASAPPPVPRRADLQIKSVGARVKRADVTAQLEASRPGIEACYASAPPEAVASGSPPHEVIFHVNPDGTVLSARHPADYPLFSCVEGVLRKMHYPATSLQLWANSGDGPYEVRFVIRLD